MAFAGESQANHRYLAFAKKAEQEGRPQVARLFRAAADAETIHAMNHLKAMDGVKSTEENLQEAVRGETREFTDMYPGMILRAEKAGKSMAVSSFTDANKVEKIHAGMYEEAMQAVKKGKDLEPADMYVCQVCGNTVKGEPPGTCPICGMPKSKFKKIE